MSGRTKYTSVDQYMADFSGETKTRLKIIRQLIHDIAPESTERISYNIPGVFMGKEIVVYFSGYEHHVSLYPGEIPAESLNPELAPYLSGKSTLKFPNDRPLPLLAIKKYVQSRARLA
jgi:uncharacterized protein YdhG (YjbR/CyaY superfamily)